MPNNSVKRTITIGTKQLTIESGGLARQADGAVVISYGDSVVLVSACASPQPREGGSRDFLPLSVDYREYTYAAGKIPGGFFKREGRPSEKETITCRLTDRPIRPLFPAGYFNETQVIGMVLSSDQENDTDVHAVTGAGAALYLSQIPYTEPIAAVRVGLIEESFVINPTFSEIQSSALDLIVVGSDSAIVMIEGSAREVGEDIILKAIEVAYEEIKKIVQAVREMYEELNIKKIKFEPNWEIPDAVMKEVEDKVLEKLKTVIHIPVKQDRVRATYELKTALLADLADETPEKQALYKRAYTEIEKNLVRNFILSNGKRTDMRHYDEIREIIPSVGVLPRTHGSALFRRGETVALATVTLGTPADVQRVDALEGESKKRFMLHYNFPPFSVGEVSPMRGPKRREIGHGVLAERALRAVIPPEEKFPYTLRIVSDILESNGSSSMATVCGGSLALMDAGAPITSAVSGIAMGLFKEGDKYAVLTDIAGYEDHYGDMDFKAAGTAKGITALQMDIKIKGVDFALLKEVFEKSKKARLDILDKMNAVMSAPREAISPYAPQMEFLQIDKSDIAAVIGPGGKIIRGIIEKTGAEIDISDDGKVCVSGLNPESVRNAMHMIKQIVEKPEVGKLYTGTITSVREFGAFVEILPGKEGLLHVSEIAPYHIEDVHTVLKEGETVTVKLISIDETGRLRLSKKAAEGFESTPQRTDRNRDNRPRRNDDGRKPRQRRRPF